MLGSDLRRVWWGAWGDPVSCRGWPTTSLSATSRRATPISSIRPAEQFEPGSSARDRRARQGHDRLALLGFASVVEGRVDVRHARSEVLDQEVGRGSVTFERIERFTQSIGDSPYSEIEIAMPGVTVDEQVAALSTVLPAVHRRAARDRGHRSHAWTTVPAFGLSLRIRGGSSRVGGLHRHAGCDQHPAAGRERRRRSSFRQDDQRASGDGITRRVRPSGRPRRRRYSHRAERARHEIMRRHRRLA